VAFAYRAIEEPSQIEPSGRSFPFPSVMVTNGFTCTIMEVRVILAFEESAEDCRNVV
jgi:hypothetical protein